MENNELSDYDSYMFALILSVNRLYDVCLMLLSEYAGEETAQQVRELHQQGVLWAPPPFNFEDTDDE